MKHTAIRQKYSFLQTAANFPEVKVPDHRNGMIVRMPNHLGDAVMALPALQVLKRSLPENCGLFVVTPTSNAQLFQALDFVDDIIHLQRPHRFWSGDEIRQIRALRPGSAVLFNHSFRDALCFKFAGVPSLYGEPSRHRGWLLQDSFCFGRTPSGQYSSSHQSMRYLAIAEAFGGKADGKLMPEFKIPLNADELPEVVSSLFFHPMILTLAPGAAYGAAKRWPHEYFAKIAEYWIRRGGIVAVCGSGGERDICNAVCRCVNSPKCIDLCGKTDLFSLMHLFRRSAFAVTNDSGLMHLAAACGCSGATVFGPTDLYDTGPVSDGKWIMLHDRHECAPCLRRVCPYGHAECTKKITPSKVIRVLAAEASAAHLPLEKLHRISE